MSDRVVVNSVPFQTRLKHGAKQLLAHDKARAQKLLQGLHPHGPLSLWEARHRDEGDQKPLAVPAAGDAKAAKKSIDVTDAGVTYTVPIGVGQPPTEYTLLIDTGSSNTWIGADKKYKHTSTGKSTGNKVNVTYGSGSFTGTEYLDQLTLGNFVIKNQSIGVSSSAQGFSDVDGILGIGPVDLTTGTVKKTASVPTITDNLYKQGLIKTESIGISYNPTTENGQLNGEMSFGETDSSRYTGEINYVPVSKTSPASKYWGVDQTLTYGKGQTILKSCAGIVDTGTTLLMIATDAFNAYQKATGATMDKATGLLTVTEEQFSNMQSLNFDIGGVTYEFTANGQIWPRSLNSMLGGEVGKIYLIVADLGNDSGSGLDFINGFAFLQRFYTVYDTTNSQIGFATTQYTDAETN